MIDRLFDIINLSYFASINLMSYAVLKGIAKWTKFRLHKKGKRIVSVIIGIVLGLIYYYVDNVTLSELIPSFLLALLAYDYYFKAVLDKFKIGYKNDK